MIKSSKFFLFYFLSLFVGSLSIVDPQIVEENRNKYPWMVIIYSVSKLTGIINYGTIIHERAVLTLANPMVKKFGKFKFQVLPDCYINETHSFTIGTKKIPLGLQQIKEYHLIEYGSPGNLEILILKEPLHLSNTINIISLYGENDQFDPDNCILLSLFSDFTIDSSALIVNEVIFFISYAVKLTDTHLDLVTLPNDTMTPVNEQGKIIQQNKEIFTKGLKLVGGPLYCKSKDTEQWSQLGVTNLVIKIQKKDDPKLIIEGNIIRVDNNTLHTVMDQILKTSDIGDFQLNDGISRY
ncbi:uncharacterized protein [Chelonus insularis]|uniref:uncharacterized protein n=1 Tax=Chelonus insularis TaxID=460826 RepID=UPI001588910A|nr:uncharacterized protein LOC118065533 [Chelonus insularis]